MNPLVVQAVAQGKGATVTDPAVIAKLSRIIGRALRERAA